jgi:hypothetical protein
LFSCGQQPYPARVQSDPDRVQLYQSADDSIFTHRCDNLTFKALWAAYAAPKGIYKFQYDGVWHRDESPCYPGNSQSEISYDGMLALMHYLWRVQDIATVRDIEQYGEEHNWVMGAGRRDLVWMPHLWLITNRIIKKAGSDLTEMELEGPLTGYRAHLEIMRMWLFMQINGELDPADTMLLKMLRQWNIDSPMVQALAIRFMGGDESLPIRMMDNLPVNAVPQTSGSFGWGSCPDALYFLIVSKILTD